MKGFLVAGAALLCLPSCWVDTVGQDRECLRLIDDLSECLGVELLPSDCNAISTADVRTFSAALDGSGCEFLSDALPGDGDLRSSSCRLYGEGCMRSNQAEPPRVATRFPIVLVNGVDVSPLFRWSGRIVETLRASGHSVHYATLPAYSSVLTRTQQLREIVADVRSSTGADKVNLICHSYGGLDCRFFASPGGLAFEREEPGTTYSVQVASITTVGTAHFGTPIADGALGLLPGVSERDATRALAGWVGDWFGPDKLESDSELRASLTALSESQAPVFNAAVTDAPGVFMQSWAGFSRPRGEALEDADVQLAACVPDSDAPSFADWNGSVDYMASPLVMGADFVGEIDGPLHDGLCPVSSARWGLFRGCVPADHMEQLGQQRLPEVNVRTGFDIARFYAHVAADLGLRGF